MCDDINSWKRENFEYTRCYCEENIWKVCEKLKSNGSPVLERSYVTFISNSARKIPLWKQKSGNESSDHLVIWDYHVILVVKSEDNLSHVVDFDTVLNFVSPFIDYYNQAIREESSIIETFRRKFRVVPATEFLLHFASDRSHMLLQVEDGRNIYWSPPPPHQPIKTDESTNNIQDFISMESSLGYGAVHDLKAFVDLFVE